MKLKHYALVLIALTILEIIILALSTQGGSITELSISKIGSLKGNYAFFLLSTSLLIIMFALYLHKVYETINRTPKNALYVFPLLSVIALLFKSGPEMNASRILHSVLFVLSGILVLVVMWDLNAALQTSSSNRFFTAPKIALFGTIIIFIMIGLNVITELVYLGAVMSWIHNVGSVAGNIA